MKRARGGFSLVELLVVIGIVGLLIAMLLPALARVRHMARGATCLANLQQWSASFQMYVAANHGHAIANPAGVTDLTWYEQLQPYNGDLRRTLLCPEATEPGNAVGSASTAWGPNHTFVTGAPDWQLRGEFVGSYGFNAWVADLSAGQRSAMQSVRGDPGLTLPTRQPERVPLLGDCIMDWAMPQSGDGVPSDLQHPLPFYSGTGPRPVGPSGMLCYYCIDRHRRAINMVFLDGHAEPVGLADLWKLRWSDTFVPHNEVLPP